MAAALLSICCSAFKPTCPRTIPFLHLGNRDNLFFISDSIPSLTLRPARNWTAAKSTGPGASSYPETNGTGSESVPEAKTEDPEAFPEVVEEQVEIPPSSAEPEPKREEVFAVVMVGSRQYIVFPGRYIYTQRIKGANVNDKIKLNKVLLVGTKSSAYIGKPIVPNATVQAIVEEQALDKKVIVFKYKKKKHYRRNIGHRQPITRLRITNITGYQDSPVVTLPVP